MDRTLGRSFPLRAKVLARPQTLRHRRHRWAKVRPPQQQLVPAVCRLPQQALALILSAMSRSRSAWSTTNTLKLESQILLY